MSKLNFENIIREKIEGYEMPLSGGEWTKFTKKTGFAGKGLITAASTKIILIASLFLIPAFGVYYLMNAGKIEKNKLFKKHSKIKPEKVDDAPVDSIDDLKTIIIEQEEFNEIEENAENETKEHIYMFTPIVNGKKIYFGPSEAKHEKIKKFRMIIRDTNGRTVFVTDKSNVFWDGRIKGKDRYAKDGIYNWFIIIIDSTDSVYRKYGKVKLTKK